LPKRRLMMKITFIHPPLDDPTIPYHSTAYLHGHLVKNGFHDVATRDLNIEFVDYCLEEATARRFRNEMDRRLGKLHSKTSLTFAEQEEAFALWSAARTDVVTIRQAAANLRAPRSFLQFDTYCESVDLLEQYLQSIAALCYPADILNFKVRNHGRYSIYNFDDLLNVDLCHRIYYPLERFFFDRCINDPELLASDCIGISIVYDHQLFGALHMARLIKQAWPQKVLLIGGTSVSQCYKYLRDKSLLKRLFQLCDGIVVGEGETAMCEIASRGGLHTPESIPNLITYDAAAGVVRLPRIVHYEHVATLGAPLYRHPWELYLSPERAINYSPTRGCYWNRCTFCDYGLNTDKPTSPWRERPVGVVIDDLKKIAREENVKYVYFAVDVMAPGYLERLSDALDEAHLDLRWSAEVRMEKIFSQERCRKMARSGCVSISFGMESGNQRILNLIDKGTKVAFMGETMKNFAAAGIAVQLMAFSHFPTETAAERKETSAFVEANKEHWSAGGVGKFVLTGTALVAKNPEKFGITLIEPQGADIKRSLGFHTNDNEQRHVLSAEDGDDSFDDTNGLFPNVLHRPWAGSTDSLHSMIYYDEYGASFFKDHCSNTLSAPVTPAGTEEDLSSTLVIHGQLAETDLDIDGLFRQRAQLRDHIAALRQSAIEPTYTHFKKWAQELPSVEREKKSYWIIQRGRCLKIAHLVHTVLSRAAARACSIAELLEGFNPQLQERLLEHLRVLEKKRYITRKGRFPHGNLTDRATGSELQERVAPNLVAASAILNQTS
jgi:anaerobic magnesium-protoporphyrin IX monomethyl ester cyclase